MEPTRKKKRRVGNPDRVFCPLPTAFSHPLARPLQLSDLALDQFAFERAHFIEKDDPVAVIRLMQHATRRQFQAVDFKVFAVYVVCAHHRSQAALNRSENAGKRKAAFLAVLFTFDPQRSEEHTSELQSRS